MPAGTSSVGGAGAGLADAAAPDGAAAGAAAAAVAATDLEARVRSINYPKQQHRQRDTEKMKYQKPALPAIPESSTIVDTCTIVDADLAAGGAHCVVSIGVDGGCCRADRVLDCRAIGRGRV